MRVITVHSPNGFCDVVVVTTEGLAELLQGAGFTAKVEGMPMPDGSADVPGAVIVTSALVDEVRRIVEGDS